MSIYIKKGGKFAASHLIGVVICLFIMTLFSWATSNTAGDIIVKLIYFLIYFSLLYSEAWNMGRLESKKYSEVKATPVRALKASVITLIIPALIIVFYFTPITAWRAFSVKYTLTAGTKYTAELSGDNYVKFDNIRLYKAPKDESKPEEYYNQENLLKNSSFEEIGGWTGGKITSADKKDGEKSLELVEDVCSQSFTVAETGDYFFVGYYKGKGEGIFSINDGSQEKDFRMSELTIPLNKRIFNLSSILIYIPLSLFMKVDNGTVSLINVIALIPVLPLIVFIGYTVGTTGFSLLDKYAAHKNKRLAKKKAAAVAEKEEIRKQRRQMKK